MENRYSKFLAQNVIKTVRNGSSLMMSTRQLESFGAGNFSLDTIYITSPRVINDKNHKHTFSQYLCFFSSNPDDANDFEAEIELTMGEELSKQIITVPTVAYIEAGMYHGPLIVTKLVKPILFIDIAITGAYAAVTAH